MSPKQNTTAEEHKQVRSRLDRTGTDAERLSQRLWRGVWRGRFSNDGYAALRKGDNKKKKFLEVLGTRISKR